MIDKINQFESENNIFYFFFYFRVSSFFSCRDDDDGFRAIQIGETSKKESSVLTSSPLVRK